MFVILLVFFSSLRLGLDHFSQSGHDQPIPSHSERKLLMLQNQLEEQPLNGTSYEYDGEEEAPEQAATCKSEFDKTIGVVLFTGGVLYCFVGLAIICEGEFKDSVVELARFLNLPPDVAGATLMAAGTSSPELFTSLVAVAGPVADIGTGTVVGSAIFNLMVIIGGCAIFSSFTFHLNWKPILRDSAINLFSFVFLYIIFYDQLIHWYEAFLGCFLYVAYVAMMGVNTQIMNGMDFVANFLLRRFPFLAVLRNPEHDHKHDHARPVPTEGDDVELQEAAMDELSDDDSHSRHSDEDAGWDDEKPHEHYHYPTSVLGWVWFVLAWPYEFVFSYTIPPVQGRYKYQFIASFVMSLVWLAVFTTFMVKWTEKIGCILGIEDAIMGVTFLALGTSMPDCLTSIFIARTGRGNMAVCNALGSNIFDILLALSLPWALSTIVSRGPVAVKSDSLNEDVIILTGTLSVFLISLCANRWRLNKTLGALYFVVYSLFVVYTVLKEMQIL